MLMTFWGRISLRRVARATPHPSGRLTGTLRMESKSTGKTIAATFCRLAFCGLALALAGCTITTHKPGGKKMVMSQEEFADYVEHVFRYHNQVMNSLIESADERGEQDSAEARELSAAEAKMIEICQPLNEVVSESLSGKSVGLQTEMELADTVPACEEASQVVEELIP
jgi:hypothetical protein